MWQELADFVFDLATRSAELSGFSSPIQLAVAANFGFSALFKLGKFSGLSIDDWAAREQLRVFSAMAETPSFNGIVFAAKLEKLKNFYRQLIFRVNCTAAIWAVIVAIIGVPLLTLMPFYPKYLVSPKLAMICMAIGFGPIPVGMSLALLLHIFARGRMWVFQKMNSTFLSLFQPTPINEIRNVRERFQRPNRPVAPRNRPHRG
jgi:hypothetical protein